MRHSCLLVTGLLCALLSSVFGSYEAGYSPTHAHDHDDYYEHEPSYPAPPIVHPHHHGQSAGSYYHYHVPLVGQQQHYQPSHYHQDHSHYLWPLLLLLALPLLFLPLLPLLLLPLGISLLALLAPGGMMMMMMMMMMGGEMMRRTDTISGRAFNEMKTFGEVILLDTTSLLTKYARSLDLDQCPQRIACEIGAVVFPENNSTDTSTAKAFSSFIMEQYLPKGKVRRTIKQYEKAFWSGSNGIQTCKAFNCQPTFKVYQNFQQESVHTSEGINGPVTPTSTVHKKQEQQIGPTTATTKVSPKNVNYIYPHSNSKVNVKTVFSKNHNYMTKQHDEGSSVVTTDSPKPKTKRSHHFSHQQQRYGDFSKAHVENTQNSYLNSDNANTYFGRVFGTPTIKS